MGEKVYGQIQQDSQEVGAPKPPENGIGRPNLGEKRMARMACIACGRVITGVGVPAPGGVHRTHMDATTVKAMIKEANPDRRVETDPITVEQIPGLLDRLKPFTPWEELPDDATTVLHLLDSAEAKRRSGGCLTSEEQEAVALDEIVQGFLPGGEYRLAFTVDELRGLAGALQKLAEGNRPDFDDVESWLIDYAIKINPADDRHRHRQVQGVMTRAGQNKPGRKGMNFGTMVDIAEWVNQHSRQFAASRYADGYYPWRAVDPHADKTGGKPNLSEVYSFVVNRHYAGVIGERRDKATPVNQEAFLANCEIIEKWFAEVMPLLGRLPDHIKLPVDTRPGRSIKKPGQVTSLDKRNSRNVNFVGASFKISQLIKTMRVRRDGHNVAGLNKSYVYDIEGVLNQQRHIGHVVEELRRQLSGVSGATR